MFCEGDKVQETEGEVQTNVQMYSSVLIREGIQIYDNFIINTSTNMQNTSKRAYSKEEVQTNVQMYSSVLIREGIQIFDNFIINTSHIDVIQPRGDTHAIR